MFIDFPIPTKSHVLPILLSLLLINWNRYERGFDIQVFKEKWDQEPASRKRRNGILIVLGIVMVILFPIAVGVLKNILGLDI